MDYFTDIDIEEDIDIDGDYSGNITPYDEPVSLRERTEMINLTLENAPHIILGKECMKRSMEYLQVYIFARDLISQTLTQKFSEGIWDADTYIQYCIEIIGNGYLSPKSKEVADYLARLDEYVENFIVVSFNHEKQYLMLYTNITGYNTTLYDNIIFMAHRFIGKKSDELGRRYNQSEKCRL